jgi:hypothetical protein
MLISSRSSVSRPVLWSARPGGEPLGWRRVRRILIGAAPLSLIPEIVSFARMLSAPSNSSFFIRTVEWVRGNGDRGLVDDIENLYYSLTAPAKGGPALRRLSHQAGALAAGAPPARHVVPANRPANIQPLVPRGLPGEGVSRPTFAAGGPQPPVLITQFRPEPVDYPQAVAGGFVYHGHTYVPLRSGMGTIVGYTSGRVDVTEWHGGPVAGPDVAFARQNLPLIVNHGRPNPNLNDGPRWGFTLGNKALVWRSAVGVDAHGNLIYAAGPEQGLGSLASVMIHARAVRAMELDINTYWTSFITYRFSGAHDPANLLATMDRSPLRYLTPDDRDFFAVYVR